MAEQHEAEFNPNFVVHPGEVVIEYLDHFGWSRRDLARKTGLSPKTISEICNGKTSVTAPTSLAFELVFGRPAHFWLNLQSQFDESVVRSLIGDKQPLWIEWAMDFPLSELNQFGFIESKDEKCADALLRFFQVSSPETWIKDLAAKKVAYRQTRNTQNSIAAISAWIRATEVKASEIETAVYDEDLLNSLIPEIRKKTCKSPTEFIKPLEQLCAEAGVAVVWLQAFENTTVSGCARWLTPQKALIALSLRYETDDQVWFTFFHELAHIILHKTRHSFVVDNAVEFFDDRYVDPEIQREEDEANLFAADTLIPPSSLARFIRQQSFTSRSITEFAESLDIAPGIVVGRLQRDHLLGLHERNELKRVLEWRPEVSYGEFKEKVSRS